MKNTVKMITALLLLTLALTTGAIALAEEATTEEIIVVEEQVEKTEKKAKKSKKEKKSKKKAKVEEVAIEETEEVIEAVVVEEEKAEAVEVTEEASNEDSEMIFEDEQVPMSAGIIDISEISIVVNKSISAPKMGDKVKLSAELKTNQNLSGCKIKYQWQVDKGDGKGYRDIEKKANKDTFSIKLSEKNIGYTWRVNVNVA